VSGLPTGDLLDTVTVTVDLPLPRRVLAVGAHPDDIEFGAGATLAKWAAAGCAVHHLVLTDGSKGSWDPDEDLDQLVAARMHECREAAAALYGGPDGDEDRVHFLGAVDGELVNDVATRRAIARVIRDVRPDVLLGHDPWRRYRLHPDHRAAGFLMLDALVAARDPHFFPELGRDPHRPDSLLLFEADLPNHVEDATGFESQKVEALLCHRSQFESTMGIRDDDPQAGAGTGPRRAVGDAGAGPVEETPAADGYASFAAKVRHQLLAHGSLADRPTGEAFHRITAL
jgi:LmbE family N-acetylglucosaminyl deacetylase